MGARSRWCPVFPLGVKKDVDGRAVVPACRRRASSRRGCSRRCGGTRRDGAALLRRLPGARIARGDIALKLAGAGGDGAQTAAMLIAPAAINEGFDATHIPSYGPESRGGTSYADVHVAEDEVLSPAAPHPHVLVAFNAPSLAKFGPTVAPRRHDHLRQLGDRRGAAARRRGQGRWACRSPRSPTDLGKAGGEEHRGARRAAGGDATSSREETFLDRHPPGAEGEVRHDPAQRRGVRLGQRAVTGTEPLF